MGGDWGRGGGYRKVRVPFRVSSLPFLRRAGPKPRLSVWGGEGGGREGRWVGVPSSRSLGGVSRLGDEVGRGAYCLGG